MRRAQPRADVPPAAAAATLLAFVTVLAMRDNGRDERRVGRGGLPAGTNMRTYADGEEEDIAGKWRTIAREVSETDGGVSEVISVPTFVTVAVSDEYYPSSSHRSHGGASSLWHHDGRRWWW